MGGLYLRKHSVEKMDMAECWEGQNQRSLSYLCNIYRNHGWQVGLLLLVLESVPLSCDLVPPGGTYVPLSVIRGFPK